MSAKSQGLKGPVKNVTSILDGKSLKITFTENYDQTGKLISGHNGTPESVSAKGMFIETKYDNEGRLKELKRLVNGVANRTETYEYTDSTVLVSTVTNRDSTKTLRTETLDQKQRVIKSVSSTLIRTVKFNRQGLQTKITMSSSSSDYKVTSTLVYNIIAKDKHGNWTELEQVSTEEDNLGKRESAGKRYRTITYWDE